MGFACAEGYFAVRLAKRRELAYRAFNVVAAAVAGGVPCRRRSDADNGGEASVHAGVVPDGAGCAAGRIANLANASMFVSIALSILM